MPLDVSLEALEVLDSLEADEELSLELLSLELDPLEVLDAELWLRLDPLD